MDLKKLVQAVRDSGFLFAFFDLLLLILPGVGILFLYERPIFMSLDWIKLILLAGAIMAPLDFMNALVIPSLVDAEIDLRRKDNLFIALTASIFATSIMVYGGVAIFYLFNYPARHGLLIIAGVEFVLLIVAFYKDHQRARRGKKKASAST